MATSKTLKPTNETISIPEMTDAPNASVFSNCISKSADAINALTDKVANITCLGSFEASQLGSPSTLSAAISALYALATADTASVQIAFFAYTGGGRWVAMIQKNSANYGTAILWSYNDFSRIWKYTYQSGTETLLSLCGATEPEMSSTSSITFTIPLHRYGILLYAANMTSIFNANTSSATVYSGGDSVTDAGFTLTKAANSNTFTLTRTNGTSFFWSLMIV